MFYPVHAPAPLAMDVPQGIFAQEAVPMVLHSVPYPYLTDGPTPTFLENQAGSGDNILQMVSLPKCYFFSW